MHAVRNAASRLLTIEINSNKTIVQARGKFNRLTTAEEIKLLRIWMWQAGLKSVVF